MKKNTLTYNRIELIENFRAMLNTKENTELFSGSGIREAKLWKELLHSLELLAIYYEYEMEE